MLDGLPEPEKLGIFSSLAEKLEVNGWIHGCLPLPGIGSRLSDLLKDRLDTKLFASIRDAEELFYAQRAPLPNREKWQDLAQLEVHDWSQLTLVEPISLTEQWLGPWIKKTPGSWLQTVCNQLGSEECHALQEHLQFDRLPKTWKWSRTWLLYRLQKIRS